MEGFEILEKLGDGAYSIVYKVRRKEDSNIYALKKVKLKGLSDKEKQNALNEVRILASVKSPFVISYKEAFIEEETETLCIVMEYADKGDLYQKILHLKKIGCLIEEIDAWKIFIQMVRGLKSLHDLKILHRDLKSANIFLFSDGTAKIGDLNVSKVAQKGLGYTQTGTPYYASPEVWNENPYDNKSDIWSLGCVTYEMLTLHPPFRAESMEGLYQKVIKGQFGKINPRYSEDIFEMIKFLLKVNPVDRPNCGQILKHPLVLKRIEFFKEQEGFKDEDIDDMDEGKLLKTLRVTKNMLFLSEQLPDANYSPKNHKITEKNKNNNTINNTTKSTKNSLPNITLNSHHNVTNEENNSESSNKMLNKYHIIDNNTKPKVPQNKNPENKKMIIKPEKAITSINNSSNNVPRKTYKEVVHSIDHDIINILPSHRLYQQKKTSIRKDKDVLKYLEGIGGNVYSRYAHQIETNKYNNSNNRNRVNLHHKSSNKNNPYLPSIYKNKYTNSVNKYAVNRKKY